MIKKDKIKEIVNAVNLEELWMESLEGYRRTALIFNFSEKEIKEFINGKTE